VSCYTTVGVVVRTFESSLGSTRMQPIFTRGAQIVEVGLVSAELPCSWLLVEIRCRVTRQLVMLSF